MHKDGTGKWTPNKVIVSPREGKNVLINVDTLKRNLVVVNKERNKLKRKKVLTYIKQGEAKGYHERSTNKSRKLWYSIEPRKAWPILHPMIHHDRQTVLFNHARVQVDHNLFEIKPKRGQALLPLFCFLLSTVSMLIKENTGRSNLGEGALKTEGIDIERLLVPRNYSKKSRRLILDLVKKYPDASIKSIFDDLIIPGQEQLSLDTIRTERRELDRIVMGEILGLTEEEQMDVYRAVIDQVKARVERAKSFGKKKKTVEGVDIDSLKDAIVTKIKEEE